MEFCNFAIFWAFFYLFEKKVFRGTLPTCSRCPCPYKTGVSGPARSKRSEFGACSALWVCTLEFCDVTTGEREDLGRELELP